MKLSVIATPIGNLEDITFRAIRTLKEADIILAEDTRVAAKLLAHLDIQGKTVWRYDEHSHEKMLPKIIEALEAGKSVALTTDAGTPCISDPGGRLVNVVVQKCHDRVKIEPVPGPSALAAAISVSGFLMDEFVFLGFPPHKKGRETFFSRLAEEKRPVVFYESPHRIIKTLETLAKLQSARQTVVCRELTKQFETISRGTVAEVLEKVKSMPIKGEFVVILDKMS